jgi:hypothetical protein
MSIMSASALPLDLVAARLGLRRLVLLVVAIVFLD